jgi:hypothetical protein
VYEVVVAGWVDDVAIHLNTRLPRVHWPLVLAHSASLSGAGFANLSCTADLSHTDTGTPSALAAATTRSKPASATRHRKTFVLTTIH